MLSFSGGSVLVILASPIHNVESTNQPVCSHCVCALTVAHVLLECNCDVVRQRYFNVSSLHELFDTVNAQNILGFIRDIGIYRLL